MITRTEAGKRLLFRYLSIEEGGQGHGADATRERMTRYVAAIEAEAIAALQPREGERLILASDAILIGLGTRTGTGDKITAEWGEPDERGWYAPTFTVHADDNLLATYRHELIEKMQGLAMGRGRLVTDGTTITYTGDIWAYRAAVLALIEDSS